MIAVNAIEFLSDGGSHCHLELLNFRSSLNFQYHR